MPEISHIKFHLFVCSSGRREGARVQQESVEDVNDATKASMSAFVPPVEIGPVFAGADCHYGRKSSRIANISPEAIEIFPLNWWSKRHINPRLIILDPDGYYLGIQLFRKFESLKIPSCFEDYNCFKPICDESKKPFVIATRRLWHVHKLMMPCILGPSLKWVVAHRYRTMPDADLVK